LQTTCYENLGHIYRSMNELKLAGTYLRAAMELQPRNIRTKAWLVETLQWQGDDITADALIAEGISMGLWERPDQIISGGLQRGVKAVAWPNPMAYRPIYHLIVKLQTYHENIWNEAKALLLRSGTAGLSFGSMEDYAIFDNTSRSGGWHTKELDCAQNAWETPETCNLITDVNMTSVAVFSVQFLRLEPGATIRPHCGPTNRRWVIHLGLDIPDNVTITVAGEMHNWIQGRCILFDDSFRHSVTHHGNRDRIVLALRVPNYAAAHRAPKVEL